MKDGKIIPEIIAGVGEQEQITMACGLTTKKS
jgi:hypothetical protein